MEFNNFREARHKFHNPWTKINASQITALLVKIPSGTVWHRGGQDPVEKQIPYSGDRFLANTLGKKGIWLASSEFCSAAYN